MIVSESERACVVVMDERYECMVIDECKFRGGVCVWLKVAVGKLIVVSLYCGVNERVDEAIEFLNGVIEILNGRRLIVGMDANATSELWHSKDRARNWYSVKRGECLTEWIIEKGMDVLNEPTSASAFSGASGESVIDVTLFKGRACGLEWNLMDEWGVSDHNAILVRMSVNDDERVKYSGRVRKWNARKCDWERYMEHLAFSASALGVDSFRSMTAEGQAAQMNEWIMNAHDVCMKRVKGAKKRTGAAWWNESLEECKRKVRMMRKAYQRERKRTGDPERVRWNAWKECVKEYKKKMRECKKNDWRRFMSEESERDPWGRVYRVCREKGSICIMSGLRTANGWMRTWKENARVLLDEFFPISEGVAVSPDCHGEESVNETTECSLGDVSVAVLAMRMGKAPGMYGITNEMIKRVWRAVPEYVRMMYESCMKEGLFPKCWKEARVVTLFKSADKDKTKPRPYRPIRLLSGVGKVFERMMG